LSNAESASTPGTALARVEVDGAVVWAVRRGDEYSPLGSTLSELLRLTPAEAREAVRYVLLRPPLPLAARPPYGVLAAAAVGLMPAWTRLPLRLPYLPVSERTVVRALGGLATGTIRWAMTPPER